MATRYRLDELIELAHKRAEKRASRPTMTALRGGFVGLGTTAIFLSFFIRHAKPIDFFGVWLILMVMGFFVPFAYFYFENRAYRQEWEREYQALKEINDAVPR